MDHSRWLTTACRFCRLYISDHNLGEEDSENLREIVSFIIYQYAKMWFEIKCKNKLIHGPDNALLNIQIIEKFAPPKVLEIVKPVVERGSWHAHENILYTLLCSPIEKDRTFAVKQILKIRGNNDM